MRMLAFATTAVHGAPAATSRSGAPKGPLAGPRPTIRPPSCREHIGQLLLTHSLLVDEEPSHAAQKPLLCRAEPDSTRHSPPGGVGGAGAGRVGVQRLIEPVARALVATACGDGSGANVLLCACVAGIG